MFTGIIETLGMITEIKTESGNKHFVVRSSIADELKIDQSVAHNGVCLTVVGLHPGTHTVTAIDETLQKTNLNQLQPGNKINIERCMKADGRFDGHIVQGHVEDTAVCIDKIENAGSWLFVFEIKNEANKNLLIEKGSVCVNGVSLTCFDVNGCRFTVAIIPYTFQHTNFNEIEKGTVVNIEYDVIGKYVRKMMG